MIWIKGGWILDPSDNTDELGDILIKDGKIAARGIFSQATAESYGEDIQVIDASGKKIMPGLVDLHVHFREPGFEYKETIKTGASAAAKGGFTAVCPMPNTKPAVDSPEMIQKILDIAEKDSPIHIYPVGAITKGQMGDELVDIKGMAEAGAKAFSEDGKSVMNAEIYREAMKIAAEVDVPIMAHCEDKNMVGQGAMNEGAKSRELGIPGISNAVEDVIVARDILIAKDTGARLHLCHCSTEDSVKMIRCAREDGVKVSGEVCPHHFTLTDQDIVEDDANYKMNPPLRSRDDVEALKRGLGDGTMEAISTDHAPHSEEEKSVSIKNAPFGIVGSETAFCLGVTELVESGILTPLELVRRMSTNPCRILGVEGGSLQKGSVADITIADFDEEYVIDKTEFLSKGKNTPFDGKKVKGRIYTTIVEGKVVYSL
ncbi:MAG: dihydroorotase [Eubacterium sp.]|nr:dihydroorotase [Eubacterium sp.]